jgi:thioredoxin reductase
VITRRKVLLGGLLLTGGLLSSNYKTIARARAAKSGDNFEAAVVGGGFAGLQAALTLGRACRKVILFDSGKPRNAGSGAFHNFIGYDGVAQAKLFAQAKEQLSQYDITICNDRVEGATVKGALFSLTTAGGLSITSKKVLLATGLKDSLPQIKGMSTLWGKGVYYCPFCSGWEVRNKPLAVLGSGDGGANAALTLTGWSKDIVLLTGGEGQISPEKIKLLKKQKIDVIEDKIEALEGNSNLTAVVLAGGKKLKRDAIFLQPIENHASPLLTSLGAKLNGWGLPVLNFSGHTSVSGLYVAGDASGKPFQAIGAAADGATAAFALSRALIFDGLETAGEPTS